MGLILGLDCVDGSDATCVPSCSVASFTSSFSFSPFSVNTLSRSRGFLRPHMLRQYRTSRSKPIGRCHVSTGHRIARA
eukprot:1232960-Rhodomonas_salina.2